MLELVRISFATGNIVLTLLLLICIAYWALVIVGALGIDFFSPDADVDADSAGAADGLRGLAGTAMRFCNVGEVPIMLFVSIAILVAWATGVLAHRWVGDWSIVVQLLALLPFLAVGIVGAKLLTTPVASIIRRYREQVAAEQTIELVGRRCRVVSGTLTTSRGQIEVDTDGAPMRFNARSSTADEVLRKDDEAVILSIDEKRRICRVRAF